jgi:hypothetical protein
MLKFPSLQSKPVQQPVFFYSQTSTAKSVEANQDKIAVLKILPPYTNHTNMCQDVLQTTLVVGDFEQCTIPRQVLPSPEALDERPPEELAF